MAAYPAQPGLGARPQPVVRRGPPGPQSSLRGGRGPPGTRVKVPAPAPPSTCSLFGPTSRAPVRRRRPPPHAPLHAPVTNQAQGSDASRQKAPSGYHRDRAHRREGRAPEPLARRPGRAPATLAAPSHHLGEAVGPEALASPPVLPGRPRCRRRRWVPRWRASSGHQRACADREQPWRRPRCQVAGRAGDGAARGTRPPPQRAGPGERRGERKGRGCWLGPKRGGEPGGVGRGRAGRGACLQGLGQLLAPAGRAAWRARQHHQPRGRAVAALHPHQGSRSGWGARRAGQWGERVGRGRVEAGRLGSAKRTHGGCGWPRRTGGGAPGAATPTTPRRTWRSRRRSARAAPAPEAPPGVR
jgi:hypothetical protein